MDQFFLVGEFFTGADFFEDVVKAGEREAVLGLDALAVRVQFLRQFADGLFLRLAAKRKRKRIKAIAICCRRGSSSNASRRRPQGKCDMNPAAQNAKMKSIIKCEDNNLLSGKISASRN